MEQYIQEVIVTYRPVDARSEIIREAETAAEILRKLLLENSREHFYALYLDTKNRVINYALIGVGALNKCQVSCTEIIRRALMCGSVSIIVGHNHPSGDLEPSAADEQVTKQLVAAARTVELKLLDHIIFDGEEHLSLAGVRSHLFT